MRGKSSMSYRGPSGNSLTVINLSVKERDGSNSGGAKHRAVEAFGPDATGGSSRFPIAGQSKCSRGWVGDGLPLHGWDRQTVEQQL